MCASSGEDESVKLICAVVCCELAVQCRDAHEWTSVLKPLLDLLLAPTCFRKTEVRSSHAPLVVQGSELFCYQWCRVSENRAYRQKCILRVSVQSFVRLLC